MMRHKIAGAGLGTLLLLGGLAEPLAAQEEEDVVDQVVDDEKDEGGFDDWGLLGLLGLAGLAGLAKKRDNQSNPTVTRPAGSGGGSNAVR